MTPLTTHVPPEMKKRVQAQAEALGVNTSDFLLLALDAYMEPAVPFTSKAGVPQVVVDGVHWPTQVSEGRLWLRWSTLHKSGLLGRSTSTYVLSRLFGEDDKRKLEGSLHVSKKGPADVIHVCAIQARYLMRERGHTEAATTLDKAITLV